jgi:hypothetical protein
MTNADDESHFRYDATPEGNEQGGSRILESAHAFSPQLARYYEGPRFFDEIVETVCPLPSRRKSRRLVPRATKADQYLVIDGSIDSCGPSWTPRRFRTFVMIDVPPRWDPTMQMTGPCGTARDLLSD